MNLFENHNNWTHHGILIPGLTSHQLERQVIHNDAVFWIFVKIYYQGVFKLQYVQVPFWKWPKERAYFQSPATLRIIPVIFVYTCSHMVRKPLERPLFAVFCTYSVFCMNFTWDWFENLKSPIFVYKYHFFQHLTMDDPWRAITRRDLSSIIWRMWRPYIARPYGTVCQLIYHSNL